MEIRSQRKFSILKVFMIKQKTKNIKCEDSENLKHTIKLTKRK